MRAVRVPEQKNGVQKKPDVLRTSGFDLVPRAGLEPARLAAGDFESPESTNFTTWAGNSVKRELWHIYGHEISNH